jgi:ATP-dependent RNA helicase DHX29
MAKKKKTSLKPVARGFATTSQPKKVVPEPVSEEPAPAAGDAAQDQNDKPNGEAKSLEGGQIGEGVDWEDDSKLEEGIYQGYVERLQEKGDREVAKILKVSLHDPTVSACH